MSAQEAAGLPAEERAEPVRLRLVKTDTADTVEGAGARSARVRVNGAELGAYLPTPRNLRGYLAGVGEGSAVLLGRGWGWVRGEEWGGDSAVRAGGVAMVAYAAGSQALSELGTAAGYLILPAIVAWCLVARQYTDLAVAVRAATTEAREAERARLLREQRAEIAATAKRKAAARVRARRGGRAPGAVEEAVEVEERQEHGAGPAAVEAGVEAAVELGVEDVAAIVRRVAARHPRHLGVHLADLLPEPEFEGWEQPGIKAAIVALGLPVSSFKLTYPTGPARTREGVRLEHLPQAPAGALSGAGGRVPGPVPPGAPAAVGEGVLPAPAGRPAGAVPGARSTPVEGPSGVPAGARSQPLPGRAPAPSQGPR
ncbi:hypothetical protein [Streptomyces sp. NPDC002526]